MALPALALVACGVKHARLTADQFSTKLLDFWIYSEHGSKRLAEEPGSVTTVGKLTFTALGNGFWQLAGP